MPNRLDRPALALMYLAVFCAGLTSLLWPPVSLQKAFIVDSIVFHQSWAVLAVVGGSVGAYGAMKETRWRIERWAAPLAAGGIGGYGFIVWTLTVTETFTRITQSFFITVGIILFIDRSIHLAKKAKGIRVIAKSTEQVARALEHSSDANARKVD